MRASADEHEPLLAALEAVAGRLAAKGRQRADGVRVGEVEIDARAGTDDDDTEVEDALSEWPEPIRDGSLVAEILIACEKEPRGGMFTYNYHLACVPLPSGRRLYLRWGDMDELRGVAVAEAGRDSDVLDLRVVQLLSPKANLELPFATSGDVLFQIDVLWKLARDGYPFEALVDSEADWMSQDLFNEGSNRHKELEEALEQALEKSEISETEFDRQFDALYAAPLWFLTLDDATLDLVAALPLPAADRVPPLQCKFAPWQRPTAAMFIKPKSRVNLQHIAASWVLGGFAGDFDLPPD
jgi:hypothetical protein